MADPVIFPTGNGSKENGGTPITSPSSKRTIGRRDRTGFALIAVILGLILGGTNWIAFPHEQFHVLSAAREGIDAWQIDRTHTAITRLTVRNVMAGYNGEVWFSAALAVVCALAGHRLRFLTGAGFWGYLVTTWISAYASSDFNATLHKVAGDYFPAYQKMILRNWTIVGLILIILSGIVVLYQLKKKKARR